MIHPSIEPWQVCKFRIALLFQGKAASGSARSVKLSFASNRCRLKSNLYELFEMTDNKPWAGLLPAGRLAQR